jgi:hypothetical protein
MSQATIPQDDTQEQRRKPLLDNRITIAQIAADLKVSERSVYNLADELCIPYIKVLNVRYFDPDVFRAALLASEVSRQPPKRGRPAGRKVA